MEIERIELHQIAIPLVRPFQSSADRQIIRPCLLVALYSGLACAAVAIGPAYAERGEGLPIGATLGLLAAVALSGLISTLLATRAVAASDLLPALKHE